MACTSYNVLVRAKSQIYLIGHSSQQITGSKLPSNHQVLKSIFYNMRNVGLTFSDAAKLTLKEVFVFWEKGYLPNAKNAVRLVENYITNGEQFRKVQH